MEGVPKVETVGQATPSRLPLTKFCIFFVSVSGVRYTCQIWSS